VPTRAELRPGVALGGTVCVIAAVFTYFWPSFSEFEGGPAIIWFTVGVTTSLMSCLSVISRLVFFSAATIAALVGMFVAC
jgi:glycerol-3-phosphate acyltransferase PlsY